MSYTSNFDNFGGSQVWKKSKNKRMLLAASLGSMIDKLETHYNGKEMIEERKKLSIRVPIAKSPILIDLTNKRKDEKNKAKRRSRKQQKPIGLEIALSRDDDDMEKVSKYPVQKEKKRNTSCLEKYKKGVFKKNYLIPERRPRSEEEEEEEEKLRSSSKCDKDNNDKARVSETGSRNLAWSFGGRSEQNSFVNDKGIGRFSSKGRASSRSKDNRDSLQESENGDEDNNSGTEGSKKKQRGSKGLLKSKYFPDDDEENKLGEVEEEEKCIVRSEKQSLVGSKDI